MKEDNLILVLSLSIIILLSLFFNHSSKTIQEDEQNIIASMAVQKPVTLRIFISCSTSDHYANDSGSLNFTNSCANNSVSKIDGLVNNSIANFSNADSSTYPDWTEREPVTNEIKEVVRYFELNVSHNEFNLSNITNSSFNLEFTIFQNDLNSEDPENIRLFSFEDNTWEELPTIVVNENSNPLIFQATLTHFSKFIVGVASRSSSSSSGSSTSESSDDSKSISKGNIRDKEALEKKLREKIEPLPQSTHVKGSNIDVTLHLLSDIELSWGDFLEVEIEIFNLENDKIKDINLNYYIQEQNGPILFKNFENIKVKDKIILKKKINISSYAEEGNYLFFVNVTYEDDNTIASQSFRVLGEPNFEQPNQNNQFKIKKVDFLIILMSLVILMIMVFTYKKLHIKQKK